MKEFLEYAKSKGVKEIDVDILCLLSDFFKETESKQFAITDVGSSNKINYKKGFELAIKYINITVVSMEQSKESNDYMVKLQDFIDKHKLY